MDDRSDGRFPSDFDATTSVIAVVEPSEEYGRKNAQVIIGLEYLELLSIANYQFASINLSQIKAEYPDLLLIKVNSLSALKAMLEKNEGMQPTILTSDIDESREEPGHGSER